MRCKEIYQVCSTSFTWIILLDPLHAWPFGIKTAQWNVFCHGKASEGCENCKSKHWARMVEEEGVWNADPFGRAAGGVSPVFSEPLKNLPKQNLNMALARTV